MGKKKEPNKGDKKVEGGSTFKGKMSSSRKYALANGYTPGSNPRRVRGRWVSGRRKK